MNKYESCKRCNEWVDQRCIAVKCYKEDLDFIKGLVLANIGNL